MVSHARGTLTTVRIDAGWPHQVEIEVPWNGLGVDGHNRMLAWLREHAPDHHTRSDGHRPADASAIRYCFADSVSAERFRAAFGGEFVTVEPRRSKRAR